VNRLPRFAFYAGLFFSIILGGYLTWLWQSERQVVRHTENLLRVVEERDWKRVQEFISAGLPRPMGQRSCNGPGENARRFHVRTQDQAQLRNSDRFCQ
jgi:hypothetical protein